LGGRVCRVVDFYSLCPVHWFFGQSSAADAKAAQMRLRCYYSLSHRYKKCYGHHHDLVDQNDNVRRFFFFPLSPTRLLWLTRMVSYKKQELFTLHEDLCSPLVYGVVRVAHLFSFLCCVFVFCLSPSCVLCAQCCQCFLIVHSWLPIRVSLTLILTTSPTPLKWTRTLIPTSSVKVSRPIYKAGCFTGHLDISLRFFLPQLEPSWSW